MAALPDLRLAGGQLYNLSASWPTAFHDSLPAYESIPFAKIIPIASIGIILLALFTRVASGASSQHKKDGVAAQTVPPVPYWLPIIGHIPNMIFNADGFLKGLRQKSRDGIFALNFGGTRHNIMTTPALASALFSQKSSHVDAEVVSQSLMVRVFGYPKSELEAYEKCLHDVTACYKHLMTEPYLGKMALDVQRDIQANVVNLVTFMDSPVDQMRWERSADVCLTTTALGDEVVEADLLPLIRDFCANSANKALFGSDLLDNAPDILDDMWTLDSGFFLLATGLPRWFPIPALTRAHIARRRIIQHFEEFHTAMDNYTKGDDPGSKWGSLHDVGSLIQARIPVYQQYNLNMRARASIETALLWAANANSNTLVFWMVNHIYADPELLAKIRAEIAPFVQIALPQENGLPISEPLRISQMDRDGLCNSCPHLKSVYVECLRLDTASWSLKLVKQDTVLQPREKGAQPWLLRKGDYVHAAHDLHNTDPHHFEDPMVWKADRHVKFDEKKKASADLGSIRPYGGGASMCKGRQLALQEVILFAAGIIALWDIAPARGGPWQMPRHKRATGVYTTDSITRVWVKSRKLD